jgi:hypothetical protein
MIFSLEVSQTLHFKTKAYRLKFHGCPGGVGSGYDSPRSKRAYVISYFCRPSRPLLLRSQ